MEPFKGKIVKIDNYIKIQRNRDYGNFKKDENEQNYMLYLVTIFV